MLMGGEMTELNNQLDFSKGFTRDNDIFKRHEFYQSLLKLIKNSPEEGMVIALDDKWGQGKTSFVRMMHGEILKKNQEINNQGEFLEENLNSIYFDAYENDHHSDPFIPICAEFYSLFSNSQSKVKSLVGKFLNSAARVGAAALTGGAKAVITSATAGLVSGKDVVDAAVEEVKKNALEFTDDVAKHVVNKITSAKEEKKDIENFKSTLSGIHTDNSLKTIFIIDELDRAKPDFSLDLIEKIKHLFSVKNVIFILVMNRIQFEKCIEKRYGGIDSKTYLNKFINYYVSLPKTLISDTSIYDPALKTTIYNYIARIPGVGKIFNPNDTVHIALSYLIEMNSCSLREAERCISLMGVFTNDSGKLNYPLPHTNAIIIMTFLKVYDSTLYEEFMSKRTGPDQMIKALNLNKEVEKGTRYEKIQRSMCQIINFHYFSRAYIEENSERLQIEYSDLYGYFSQPTSPFLNFKKEFEYFSLE